MDSQPDQGAIFYFTAQFQKDSTLAATPQPPMVDCKGKRALVVDDNAMALAVFCNYLEEMSFRVDGVSSGREALALLEQASHQQDPYVVLCIDWLMPELDGLATIELLHRHPAITPPVACIMISAHDQGEMVERVGQRHVDGFLTKPVTPAHLATAIRGILTGDPATHPGSTQPIPPPPDTTRFRGVRILVAEDNEINQQVAREILQEAHIQVEVVGNGALAVDRVLANRHTPYDAILMDIQMPILDGHAATQAILAHCPTLTTPIIAMSANAMKQDIEACVALGMADYVTKPIDVAHLFDTLERLIPRQAWVAPAAGETVEERAPTEATKPPTARWLTNLRPGQLPGLNVTTGLNRINHNAEIYLGLLKKFQHDHQDTAVRLHALWHNHALREAAQLAHAIKGVAGNLGAEEVQAVAGQLEHSLATAPPAATTALLAVFQAALERLLANLATLFAEVERSLEPVAEHAPGAQTEPLDRADLLALRTLLLEKNMRAGKRLTTVLPGLRAAGRVAEAEQLATVMGQLRYDEAVRVVEQLLANEQKP
ncbi:MAG: response regulator [Magnetococcales bacterium]|nr:response regulator [Magnetococcales bacterium]